MAGFILEGMKNGFKFETLMPDYTITNIGEVPAYLLSALIGISVIFLVMRIFRKEKD